MTKTSNITSRKRPSKMRERQSYTYSHEGVKVHHMHHILVPFYLVITIRFVERPSYIIMHGIRLKALQRSYQVQGIEAQFHGNLNKLPIHGFTTEEISRVAPHLVVYVESIKTIDNCNEANV